MSTAKSRHIVDFMFWQGYMDEDRIFYSVSENTILGVGNV